MRVWKRPPVLDLHTRENIGPKVVFEILELYMSFVPSWSSRHRGRTMSVIEREREIHNLPHIYIYIIIVF